MSSPYTAQTVVPVGDTINLPATNELPVDMHSSMLSSYAPITPLTVILGKLAEDPAYNFRVDWIEKREIPDTVVVGASMTAAGTTMTLLGNGRTLVLDTLLYVPRTDETLRISAAPSSDTSVTVARGEAGSTGAVINAGEVLHVGLPAIAENDENNRNASVADQNVFNFQQLCKLQYAITRSEDAMRTHFGGRGSKREELKGQKYFEYRRKKEKMLYFGGRSTGGTAPATRRTMGGLVHYLRSGTLYKDFGGILTESGFRSYLGDYKDENPDATEMWYFAAGNVIDLISNFGADKVRISPESKKFGLDIMTYRSRGISCRLVALPLLDVAVTRGWGFLLDMSRITLKTIDKDMFFPHDRNAGAGEIMYDTYRGMYSLLVANESRHSMSVGALA